MTVTNLQAFAAKNRSRWLTSATRFREQADLVYFVQSYILYTIFKNPLSICVFI